MWGIKDSKSGQESEAPGQEKGSKTYIKLKRKRKSMCKWRGSRRIILVDHNMCCYMVKSGREILVRSLLQVVLGKRCHGAYQG